MSRAEDYFDELRAHAGSAGFNWRDVGEMAIVERVSVRALVLGAGGFLGHHMVNTLLTAGWSVISVARDTTSPSVRERLAFVDGDVELIEGDAGNAELLSHLVCDVNAVFPFAGHSGASRSMRKPVEDLQANVASHLTLLEALRVDNPAARVVFPGSRLQYGPVDHLPVSEDTPQRPTSIYGLHKSTAEGYYRLYNDVHGLHTACLRISNPFGPLQERPDRSFGVVGNFIATARAGGEIGLFGGGTQLRDYVYVRDLTNLALMCVEREEAVGQIFNASGPEGVSLRTMAECVIDVVGSGSIADRPWPRLESAIETGDYIGDINLARQVLGWEPTTALRDGLLRTIDGNAN